MKKIIFTLFLGIVFFVLLTAFSRSAPPSSGTYTFKRIREKAVLMTKRTPREKADYYEVLLNLRLKELEYLLDNRQYKLLLPASLRYSATAGKLVSVIRTNNLTARVGSAKSLLISHKKQIDRLILRSVKQNVDQTNFLVDTSNYISAYIQELDQEKQN